MVQIGVTDEFENDYTERFRQRLRGRALFAKYERDRAVRDIGVHFTKPQPSGKSLVTSAFAWFQLKGIMTSTMGSDDYATMTSVPLSLDVEDLRFWYLQASPTYLGFYIQCVDTFLVLNLTKYVEARWGREIFDLKQKTVTVDVPTSSTFDEQAMALIVREGDETSCARTLGVPVPVAKQCLRDHQLIWRLATAHERGATHRAVYRPWISKRRTTLEFQEHIPSSHEWALVRDHWQQSFPWSDVEAAYPFLDFFTSISEAAEFAKQLDEQEAQSGLANAAISTDDDGNEQDDDQDDDDDDLERPQLRLKNGDSAYGQNAADEYEEFRLGVALNPLGRRLFRHVLELVRLGLVSIDETRAQFLSCARWDQREV